MSDQDHEGYLVGQFLIAMPTMLDPRFEKSVIYLCAHNEDGAMGLVVNQVFDALTFPELLERLDIDAGPEGEEIRVHTGGPVETGRGFVLHSTDYHGEGTLVVADDIALTASLDILRAIAAGEGPRRKLLALGYSGWGPGQLDSEIQANGWLHAPAAGELVFSGDPSRVWNAALGLLGIDASMLSGEAGHA